MVVEFQQQHRMIVLRGAVLIPTASELQCARICVAEASEMRQLFFGEESTKNCTTTLGLSWRRIFAVSRICACAPTCDTAVRGRRGST